MTEVQPPVTQPSIAPAPAPGVFGTKIPSTVSFAIGIILFFLPFLEITCNSMTIQTVSGVQLATGFKIKEDGGAFMQGMESSNDFKNETAKKTQNRESPNIYAAMALVFAVLGLILSMRNLKTGGTSGLIMGILSSLSLIGLLIDIGNRVKLKLPGNQADLNINIGLTPWFYISIIVFLAAAFFSFKRLKANGT
jgi:hypothetical protein